jgi:hypothetical protein
MIIYMLFALTHSNLSGQLPAETGIILRFTEIVKVRHSIGTYFWNRYKHNRFDPDGWRVWISNR